MEMIKAEHDELMCCDDCADLKDKLVMFEGPGAESQVFICYICLHDALDLYIA